MNNGSQDRKEMDLKTLSYDRWVEEHIGDLRQAEHSIARVMAVDRGAFLVRNQYGETFARSNTTDFGIDDFRRLMIPELLT